MKKLLIMHCLLAMLIFFTNTAKVSAENELETAEIRLVCAICSMGAYSDDESYLMRSTLNERGWTIEKIAQKNNKAYARAYLVSKNNIKVLAIAGTENLKDVEINFRVGRVHLNDDFTLNPYEKKTRDKIFVHRGFRDYADVVLSDGLAERLKNSVENNPNEIIYLTGHSLGGSVATIATIRLADLGISTKNLKAITFGAPAVGSHALAKSYSDKIDLTRVVLRGDVVKRSLRALGYVQFGETLEYKQSSSSDHMEHKMAVYLDCAIRDYLKAGGTLRYENTNKIATPIYVAPLYLVKGDFNSDDEKLILNALDDTLRNNFSNLTFAPAQSIKVNDKKILDEDFDKFATEGKNLGCKYTLIRIIRSKKIRDTRTGERSITLEEIILDKNGVPLSMQTSGESTAELTIFEAAIAVQENLKDNLRNFLAN